MDFIALQTALAGQYFLEREVGRGGMGVVYLAREVRLDRPVALKVLPPNLAARPELRERFLREARTAAQLSHPHVVPTYRVDEAGPFVFLAMAYVDGGTLGDRLRERGVLPPEEVARLVREVGWALAYAHARGVVHRDVKPDNILLDRASGRAMVTDFGIAHVSGVDGITGEGLVMGTAHYMSPEQAAGEPVDGRSDLYSLGIVGYQALSGRMPFDAPTVQALLAKHLTQEPPPLDAVPPRLSRVVLRCLAKLPDARPATGEALADLLDEASAVERPLPVALATWAEARDPLVPLYGAWSAVFALVAATNALQVAVGTYRGRHPAAEAVVPAACTLLPAAPFLIFQLRNLIQTLQAGYGLEDLRHALRRHLDIRRREADAGYAVVRVPIARGLRAAIRLAFTAALASLLARQVIARGQVTPSMPGWLSPALMFMAISLWILGSALGITWPGRPSKSDHLARLRLAFLDSAIGTRLVRWLGRRARRGPASQSAARPTELAIGVAADELFAALPRDAREALGALPPLIRELEEEAEAMRVRAASLVERMADLEAGHADVLADARSTVRDELSGARDVACLRRDRAITALETIRLDLLRIQAGVANPATLTELVERARGIGIAVDGRLAVTTPGTGPRAVVR